MPSSNIHPDRLTPQGRLQISRQAIVRHMHDDDTPQDRDATDPGSGAVQSNVSHESSDTWVTIKRAFRSWWHHHPASTALDFAEPVVSRYAQEKPFKLLAIAAGTGAAIAIVKPWRLISLGGLLLAALKSSDVKDAIFSILSPSSNDFSKNRKTR